MSASGLRVAVVGGGFAGLAVAHRLAPSAQHLSLFDVRPAGSAGASSVAGGLLHPLSARGTPLWKGLEGYAESKQLLLSLSLSLDDTVSSAQDTTSEEERVFFFPAEILRPLFRESDLAQWRKSAASSHTAQAWLEELSLTQLCAHTGIDRTETTALGAMRIKNAIIVHPPRYLRALWAHTQRRARSSSWHCEAVRDTDDLRELAAKHDVVVLAAGPSLQYLWSSERDKQFFLKYVQGQNLLFSNNDSDNNNSKINSNNNQNYAHSSSSARLTHALLSGEYVVPQHSDEHGHYLICGATHIHIQTPSTEELLTLMNPPHKAFSLDQIDATLREKLLKLYPVLRRKETSPPFAITAGVRLVTERTELGKIPIVGRHPSLRNVWAVGGLGSRGLVYHALMAKYLTEAILQDDEEVIPKELRPTAHYR